MFFFKNPKHLLTIIKMSALKDLKEGSIRLNLGRELTNRYCAPKLAQMYTSKTPLKQNPQKPVTRGLMR